MLSVFTVYAVVGSSILPSGGCVGIGSIAEAGLAVAGHIHDDQNRGSIQPDQAAIALNNANWKIEKVDNKYCDDFVKTIFNDKRIIPNIKVEGIYFYDDDKDVMLPQKTCYQLLEDGSPLITVGKCLPWNNKDPEDNNDNAECIGRCGVGCSDAAKDRVINPKRAKFKSHWSKACLAHDICTFFTKSPQFVLPPDKNTISNPFNSKTCVSAAKKAIVAYTDPTNRFTWKGDSSSANVCSVRSEPEKATNDKA